LKKLLLISLLVLPQILPAVTVGQIDTFEDGTTQNWIINLLGMGGGAAPPVNVTTGGPAGADDNYLLLTSSGSTAAGGRLVALNPAQWAGDYLASGVGAIRMDVKNFGTTDLHLRLLFELSTGGPPTDIAGSTNAIHVPAGQDWTSIVFPVSPSSYTALAGTVNAALAGATIARIYSKEEPGFPGDAVAAQLGIDNIQAIPEPSALLLLGSGLAFVVGRKVRQSKV
jgi:hypothetical protein